MTGIYSLLGLQDNDLTYINTIGLDRVFEASSEYLRMVDAEMMNAYGVFIAEETELYGERYKLPGGGRMQQRGTKAANAAINAYAGWDVQYPLFDYEEPVAEDDVTVAYMTVRDVQLALESVRIRSINAMRYDLLRRLMNNANFSFVDRQNGTLTVRPLANGDSVVYPPVIGSESEATEDHYLETGYVASGITDTNNPYTTARTELEEHFGTPSGFGNIVCFINSAQVRLTEALADYDQIDDSHKIFGANRDRVTSDFPAVPGRIIGRTNGVWVAEWNWVPANYIVGINLDAPPPMKLRRDPASTGLPRGLHLSGETDKHPLYARHYRNRYGVGVGNRLNGVVLELGNGGTYTIPTAYA
jgi:hypothetical protein